MNQRPISDRTVIVTGASKGIGRETAKEFAEAGANVAICSRDMEEISEAASAIREDAGEGEVLGTQCDVTDPDQVRSFFQAVEEELGGVDVLVNNVGDAVGDGKLHDVELDDWNRNFDINLTGTFLCSKAAIPQMIDRDGGSLVHVSAVNASTGIGYTAYSSAKAALHSFSRVVATQYGTHGIRSNVIVPGTIDTDSRAERRQSVEDSARAELLDQYPLGCFGRPDDIAKAAMYLGSKGSRFVTGTELTVDGGLSCGLDHTFEQEYYDIEEPPA